MYNNITDSMMNASGIPAVNDKGTGKSITGSFPVSTSEFSMKTPPKSTIFSIPVSRCAKIFGLAIFFLVLGFVNTFAATKTSTATGGTWSTGTTWVGGVVPATTDLVVIATTGANTVTMSGAQTCAGLTVNLGSNLSVNSRTLTITGSVSNSGTITVSTGKITQTGTGNFTTSGTLTFTGNGTLTLCGSLTNTGTMTLSGGGKVTFAGTNPAACTSTGFTTTGALSLTRTAGSVTFTGNVSAGGLTVNATGGTLNLGAGLTHTFSGRIVLTAGTLNGGSSILKSTYVSSSNAANKAAWTNTAGVFTANTGTVNFGAAGNQYLVGTLTTTFNNFTISTSGIKYLSKLPIVNGTLSIEGTATVSVAPTYGTAAKLQYNTTTARNAGVEWITPFTATSGIVIASTGTITMNVAKVLGCGVPLTINTGATLATNNLTLTLGGNFTRVGTGAFTAGSSSIIIGTCTVDQSISGFTTTGTVSMTKTGGTATFTGNVNGAALTLIGSGGTLSLGTGLTHTFSHASTLTGITLTNGTLKGGTSTLNVNTTTATAWNGTGANFVAESSTVVFGGANQTLVASSTFYNLTFATSGTKTLTGLPTINNLLSMEGTATVSAAPNYGSAAALQYNTTPRNSGVEWKTPFTATGGIIIANTGTITMIEAKVLGCGVPLIINNGSALATGNFALTLGGNFTRIGTNTFTAGSSNITIGTCTGDQSISGFTTTGTVSMTKTGGTATFTGNVSGAALTLNGIGGTLSLGTGLTHTFFHNTTLTGITLTNGTLKGGTSTLNVNTVTATAWNGTGSNFDPESSTVVFGASGAQTLATMSNYYNLSFSGSGIKTLTGLTININNLSISGSAKVDLADNTTSTTKLLYLGGALQAGGNWGGTGSGAEHISTTWFEPSTLGVLHGATENRLVITGSTSQTAGTTQNLTLTCTLPDGTTVYTAYTGDKTLTFSGANSSPNATVPTIKDKNGTTVAFGSPTTITFTNGVATVSGGNNGVMALYKAEGAVISATDGTLTSTGADRLFVTVSAQNVLAFTTQPGGAVAGSSWTTQPVVTWKDAYGNIVTGTAKDVTLVIANNGGPGGVLSGTTTVALNTSTGAATFSGLSIDKAGTGYTLTASAPGLSNTTSNAFDVNNPVPAVADISPTSAWAGDDAFTLTVNGSNFNASSIVKFNGNNKTTAFVSSGQLTAEIPASDITTGGTFSITVYNPAPGGGTSNSATFTVNQVTVTPNITQPQCFVSGSITVTAGGGTAPYIYDWADIPGENNIKDRTGLSAGTYSVIVTDVDGHSNTSGNLVLNAASGCTGITVCKSDVASVLSVPPDPKNTTYTWTIESVSPPGTFYPAAIIEGQYTPSIKINWKDGVPSTGAYNVCVTATNDCGTSTQSCRYVYVTAPDASAYADPACSGGTVNLYAFGGVSYSWKNPGGTVFSLEQFPVIYNASSSNDGTYTVTVTDANGCSATATAIVTVNTSPTVDGTKTNTSSCGASDGTITITTPPSPYTGYTFLWDDNTTTPNRTGLPAGAYTVDVTNSSTGCTTSKTFTINDGSGYTVAMTTISPVTCNGAGNGSLTATVTGGTSPFTFQWSTGESTSGSSTTSTISDLDPGLYSVTVTDSKNPTNCTTATSTTITEPTALQSDAILLTMVNCYGGSTGAISQTVSGGTPGYIYLWTTSDGFVPVGQSGSKNLTGLIAGTYNLSVTDANSCNLLTSYTITQPAAALTANPSITHVNCNGGTNGQVILTVGGGTAPYTYAWTGPNGFTATTKDISGLAAGTYSVTVTDAKTCPVTVGNIEVTQPTVITLSKTATSVSCFGGSDGAINLTASGGTPNGSQPYYTFSWSNGETTEDIGSLTEGTYNVRVTDAHGCFNTTSAYVSQPAVLSVSITPPAMISCYGASTGSATASASGGNGGYNYSWNTSPVQNTATANGLKANVIYTVTASDSKGCTAPAQVTLTQADPFYITGFVTDVTCHGLSTGAISITPAGGTPAYNYVWSASDGGVVPGGQEHQQNLTGLVAGTYQVDVTDLNGCAASKTFTVGQPSVLSLSTTQVDATCNGTNTGSINLTVSGGTSPYFYNWSNSASTEDISNLAAGTYSVNVTDTRGCLANTSETILEPDLLTVSGTVTHNCPSVSNGAINITVAGGNGSYTYSWVNTADPLTVISTSEDPGGLAAGEYEVTVKDSKLCTATATFTLVPLSVTLEQYPLICLDPANNASMYAMPSGGNLPYTYLWSNSATTSGILDLIAGTYTVTVKDAQLCQVVTSGTIDPITCALPTAENDYYTTPYMTAVVNGTVATNDHDNTTPSPLPLYWTLETTPTLSQGVIVWNSNDGSFTFVPAPYFTGQVVLSYEVCNTIGSCADATLTITVGDLTVSGIVYDDWDGNTDNTIDGTPIGTAGSVQLYANLVDQSTGLVAGVVPVNNSNGTYSFDAATGVLINTQFEVVLSTNQGTVGQTVNALLPPGWVNTAEQYGSNNGAGSGIESGTANGVIPAYVGTAPIASANFGIEQRPTPVAVDPASQVNPGGTNTVTVPATAFSGTDPDPSGIITQIHITDFPTGITSITIGSTTYGPDDTPWPLGGVFIPTNPAGNPTPVISIDPVDGNVTAHITFSVIDNAGIESSGTDVVDMPFTDLTITGIVFDDWDGNTDFTIDGTPIGTAGSSQIYANLLDNSGNVIAVTPVSNVDGTYSFGTADGVQNNTHYSVAISTTQGTLNQPPVITLPAGWVNTAEQFGSNNGAGSGIESGTANGVIPAYVGTAPIADANFGIEQKPTPVAVDPASQVNPGGTNTVTVPATAFSGTDPDPSGIITQIHITDFPTGITSITIGSTTYGPDDTPWPLGGVFIPTNPAGNPTPVISIDPVDGNVTAQITFSVIDNAGIESSGTDVVDMPFTDLTITGIVFDDWDGNTDFTIDGTPIGTAGSSQLYANLLDNSGNVIAVTPVSNVDGTYSFGTADGVQNNTHYSVAISTTQGTLNQPPVITLPAGWVNTAEQYGSNNGAGSGIESGTANGVIPAYVGTAPIADANFGIEQKPTPVAVDPASQVNPGGTNTVTVPATAFSGTDPDPSGIITQIHITDFPTGITSITIGSTTYGPDDTPWPLGGVFIPTNPAGNPTPVISIDPVDGNVTAQITFSVIDNAGIESSGTDVVDMPFTDLTISGIVFDDWDGNTDFTIDGTPIGTAGSSQLYANLLDNSGNVIAVTPVSNVDGTYSFGTADGVQNNTHYSVAISTTQGTLNQPPVITLPAGWVNTAEQYGSNNGAGSGIESGTANGVIAAYVGTAPIADANFGIEQKPTPVAVDPASQVNPGGTNTVTVPATAFSGTDPDPSGIITQIHITDFPTGITSITIGSTTYGPDDTPWPLGGVFIPTNPAGNPTPVISIDPVDGNVTAHITFSVIDNAGIESSGTDVVDMPFTDLTITGIVFDDWDGNTDFTIDGTPIGTAGSSQLYANLLDNSGNVIAVTPVSNVDGTYSFGTGDGVQNNTHYSVAISTTQGTLNQPPVITLPAGWVNTAEQYGSNNGAGSGIESGTANGVIAAYVGTAPIADANFGIEQKPTPVAVDPASQVNPGGTNTVTVPATAFSGTDPDPSGIITQIHITDFPTGITSITIGSTTYGPDDTPWPLGGVFIPTNPAGNPVPVISIDPVDGNVTAQITFSVIDNAGIESSGTDVVDMPFYTPVITGPAIVCSNSTGKVYSIVPFPGATGYVWTVPAGASITDGDNTPSITVSYPLGSTSGDVTVYVNSPQGPSTTAHLAITVNPLPVPTIAGPGISPSPSPCKNSTGNLYTTEASMTGYSWYVSPGGTITAGGTSTSNTVTVTWTTAGAKTISVGYTNANGCTSLAPTSANITVLGPTIDGSGTSCKNEIKTYTTESGKSAYSWSALGGTIQSGAGTNTVTVKWTVPGNRSIKVTYTDGTCTQETVYPVTVYQNAPGISTCGGAALCFNQSATYSTESGNTNYIWTISAGGTITAGGTTSSTYMTVKWDKASGSQWVKLVYTPPYACSMCPTTVVVTVYPLPVPTITGEAEACQNTSKTYTTETGKTAYSWTASGGTITSGLGTSSVVVLWAEPGSSRYVEVNYKNSNGCYAAQPTRKYVTVNSCTAPVINGSGSVRLNQPYLYTTSNGMNNYTWGVNGGKINAGGGPNDASIKITWIQNKASVSVNYTNESNCTPPYPTVLSINTQSKPEGNTTGIPDETVSPDIEVYPVPNDGMFSVEITTPYEDIYDIIIYDGLGKQIYKSENIKIQGNTERIIDLRPIPPGIYTVVFQSKEKNTYKRIVVTK